MLSTTASIVFGIALSAIGYKHVIPGSEAHRMKVMENAHIFETSATILVIICLGKLLEAYSTSRTISKLTDLASKTVTRAVLFEPKDTNQISFEG